MSSTSSTANQVPHQKPPPTRFLVRFGLIVQGVHGLPNADYAASKSSALGLLRRLHMSQSEDVATQLVRQDRAGTLSMLIAILLEANRRGVPLSLPSIADAKREDSEWVREGFQDAGIWAFFREAIDQLSDV